MARGSSPHITRMRDLIVRTGPIESLPARGHACTNEISTEGERGSLDSDTSRLSAATLAATCLLIRQAAFDPLATVMSPESGHDLLP